jgi:hypothetical protein
MRMLVVVMIDILIDQMIKVLRSNRIKVLETLDFELLDPSFEMRAHQWLLKWNSVRGDAFDFECLVIIPRELRGFIPHQYLRRLKTDLFHHHRKAFRDLANPFVVWMHGSARYDCLSARDMYE